MTLATISFQNYFRLYEKLAGMTGTAMTEAEEFHQIYKLDVVEVPPTASWPRIDRTDRIYRTEKGKFKAIVREVKAAHQGPAGADRYVSIEKNEAWRHADQSRHAAPGLERQEQRARSQDRRQSR
jgi:preprotein translocase subunit SecA